MTPLRELDVVRIKKTVTDIDSYKGCSVTVPAGEEGTVIVAGKAGGDIEFLLTRPDGGRYTAVLTLDYDLVDLVWEAPAS